MKRWIALILALAMALVMAGYSGTKDPEPTAEPEKDSNWELDYFVDDFGDPTDDAYLRSEPISGKFSNTATNNASLKVYVFFTPFFANPDFITLTEDGHIGLIDGDAFSCIKFRLLEYDKTKAVYNSKDDIVLKFKIDDKTFSTTLYGDSPNGDLECFSQEYKNRTDSENAFLYALNDGKEIKCVIQIGSSKYSFTVDGVGFSEQYPELYSAYGIVPWRAFPLISPTAPNTYKPWFC